MNDRSEYDAGWAAPRSAAAPPPEQAIPSAPPPGETPPERSLPSGYGPPPGYGSVPPAGQWVHPTAPPPSNTNGLGVAALVLGIVSLVICSTAFITGTLAIIFGVIGRRQSRERGQPSSMATTGMWLGIVGLVLSVVAIVGYVVVIGFATAASFDSPRDDDTPIPTEFTISEPECNRTTGGTVVVSGSLSNDNDRSSQSFEILVEVARGADRWRGSTDAHVGAGDSVNWTAFVETDVAEGEAFGCTVTSVR